MEPSMLMLCGASTPCFLNGVREGMRVKRLIVGRSKVEYGWVPTSVPAASWVPMAPSFRACPKSTRTMRIIFSSYSSNFSFSLLQTTRLASSPKIPSSSISASVFFPQGIQGIVHFVERLAICGHAFRDKAPQFYVSMQVFFAVGGVNGRHHPGGA